MNARDHVIFEMTDAQIAKFLTKYEVRENGCWQWKGRILPKGYGSMSLRWHATGILAHRISYWIHNRTLPACIDHLCRNRACVNPHHLQAVTNKQNVLRGVGVTAQNARKEFCKRGHKLPEARNQKMGRCCLECKRIRNANWREIHGVSYTTAWHRQPKKEDREEASRG